MRTGLIGEGALALRCLQLLHARGLTPALLCSPDGSLADAAARLNIPHVSSRGEWAARLALQHLDHLFSVRNPWILSSQELALLQGMAINFHDSLLPRYAGMHATSWALLHGEVVHGITWHEITPAIDAGRILAQTRIDVSPTETAFSLNTRCFDAAVEAFDRLLGDLVQGLWTWRPQTGQRSYFGARRRPPAQASIDLHSSSDTILNLVRALDFGLATNPLGHAKLWLGDQWLIVKSAQARPVPEASSPGMVSMASPTSWRVGTATGDIELSDLCHLDGQAAAPASLQALATLLSGTPLPRLTSTARARLSALHERACRHEKRWCRHLAQGVQPAALPQLHSTTPALLERVPMPRTQATLRRLITPQGLQSIQAIWALYLARSGREAEFDLGLPHVESLSHGMGLFAPILPCRMRFDPSMPFDTWERHVAEAIEQTLAMDTFALDLLARTPELRGSSPLPKRWPASLLIGQNISSQLGQHASLVLAVSATGKDVNWLAAPDLPRDLLDVIDGQLAVALAASERAPSTPIGKIAWMTQEDRAQLLVSWNATQIPVPELCMHELVADQARRTPDAPAARHGAEVLSYAELDMRANSLARQLIHHGVQTGDLVALSLRRGLDVLIGMLGIQKAGAAYVPIDADAPRERIETMLTQSDASLMVTHDRALAALTDLPTPLLNIDTLVPIPADRELPAHGQGVTPDNLVYCIFTSGSTGTPKGVEIRHRSLVNHALAVSAVYGLGPGERILLSASIGFDVAAEQIYPALISGAEVLIRPDDLLDSLDRFDQYVREQELTVLTLPTALWHEWVRILASRSRPVPSSLKVVGVGTEKVLSDHLAQWRSMGGDAMRFIQGYGPTEATVTCTMYVHDRQDVLATWRPLPIGRPLPNTEIYILDKDGDPVPVGMEGEIHVGGMGLARGYRGHPSLTAQQFIPHPFNPDPEARLYKTGDLGRFDADGQLIFLGRADFQVKIRGFRVELGEIEAILKHHAGVQECVVILREDGPGLRRLVAYLRIDGNKPPDTTTLTALCRQRLPDYMVPSAFMWLDKFPLNINGKLDRRALPAPTSDTATIPVTNTYHDDLEYIVEKAFAQALSLSGVPLQESFFTLGGDSLAAMGMLAQLESALSVQISLSDLFDAPSVVAFSERIRAGSSGGTARVMQLKAGSGVPIWLLASVMHYVPLAQAMSGDNPIYVVLLPLEEAMIRHGTPLPGFDTLSDRYLEVIRQHTPHGPYILGGFSFGGAIAYEVGRRLAEQGERIEQLLLFDTVLPGALTSAHRGNGPLHRLNHWRHTLMAHGARGVLPRIKRQLLRAAESRTLSPEEQERRRMQAQRMAAFAHVLREFEQGMKPYHGAMVLYRSRGEDAHRSVVRGHGFAGMVRGPWSQVDVDGDHAGMMTIDHVQTIALDLAVRLDTPAPQTPSTHRQEAAA